MKNSYYILFSQHKWLIIQETSKTVIVLKTIYIALLLLIFKVNIVLFGEKPPWVYISYQKQVALFMYFEVVLFSCCYSFPMNMDWRLEDA